MTNILSKSFICFQINRSIRKNLKQRQLIIKPNLQQQRFIQTNHQQQQEQSSKLVNFLYTGAKYTLIFSVTCGLGLITGLSLISNLTKPNFKLTRIVENKKNLFPFRLHLYQYESCPNCSQIKAYLDFFGYSYKLTEVDSMSKNDILSFTLYRSIPLITFQSRDNKQDRWNLTNTTAIISALESLRNSNNNDEIILNKYLPILKSDEMQHLNLLNPFRYHVSQSDLNSIEWRKWIDETALPVFKLNSISNLKDVCETFGMYAEKSNWKKIYSNQLRYYYVYSMRILKAYFSENAKLQTKLRLSSESNPRKLLTDIIISWENGLADNLFINGNEPNLADICMYGNVKSYEGCTFLTEAFEKHSKFSAWYDRMEEKIEKGYIQPTLVIEEQPQENLQIEEAVVADERVEKIEKDVTQSKIVVIEPAQVLDVQKKVEKFEEKPIIVKEPVINVVKSNGISQFRILTAFYMCHVIVFTYAAYMANK